MDASRKLSLSEVIRIGDTAVILGLCAQYVSCVDIKVKLEEDWGDVSFFSSCNFELQTELIYFALSGLPKLFWLQDISEQNQHSKKNILVPLKTAPASEHEVLWLQ